MIVADEWVIGAFVSIAGYFGYLTRYLLTEIKEVISKNTVAVNSLVAVVQKCEKK